MALTSSLPALNRHNLLTLRSHPLSELSGALGDLGTLLPLMIALAVQSSISLSSTLVFSGLFNILTGVLFGIPLPVQPMKALAAEAIFRRSPRDRVVAAGGWVGVAVLGLSVTGLLRRLNKVVPVPVVKGIQMGAGLQLVRMCRSGVVGGVDVLLFWVLCCGLVGVFVLSGPRKKSSRTIPFALGMFLAGVAWALAMTRERPGFGTPWVPRPAAPAWLGGGWEVAGMALGQLPLTTLNSVVAASALAKDLLPDRPAPSVTALGYSVAGMNLVGCWFGAMPVCHGAGGLAAQWRFGARSGASVIVLGVMKLLLGLVFGDSLMGVIRTFPGVLLGVMVLGAGLELARVAVGVNEDAMDLWEEDGAEAEDGDGVVGLSRKRKRALDDEEKAQRWMVMLVTVAGIVSFGNDAVGFGAGMLCHWFYRLAEWWERRRGHGELHI
jgi:hypothetical protein